MAFGNFVSHRCSKLEIKIIYPSRIRHDLTRGKLVNLESTDQRVPMPKKGCVINFDDARYFVF